MGIRVKSVYSGRGVDDGYRVLVDDYLPDSMDEYKAGVDLWLKNVMPSNGLIGLLENNPELWDEFEAKYFKELEGGKHYWVEMIARSASDGEVTLCYSSPDPERNVAVALMDYINANQETLGLKAA